MNQVAIQIPIRHVCRLLMESRRIQCDRTHLSQSAIVFAPHPDDETLGCGGTILQKKQAGAALKIVFMTDGSQSHSHLIPAEKLKAIRAKEALAAVEKLGVEPRNVLFLGIKDGTLTYNQAIAIEKVKQIILRTLPEAIFIPYVRDGVPDHDATNQIAIAALRQCGIPVTVYEYPIWFWRRWPWTVFEGDKNPPLSVWREHLAGSFQLLQKFSYAVDIHAVLDHKRIALEQHQSQMTRLKPDPRWLTLGDVSQGDFLNCFFQNYEFFRRYRLN
ncbi:PIG-L deacetylase family protein [Nostoc sp. CALU 1950]|uniref:PIG-L deacetylase family protein n=1 Tax=Nostoc sp. CALU 1950 TaxID=3104321 RepID=UPI003EBCEED5